MAVSFKSYFYVGFDSYFWFQIDSYFWISGRPRARRTAEPRFFISMVLRYILREGRRPSPIKAFFKEIPLRKFLIFECSLLIGIFCKFYYPILQLMPDYSLSYFSLQISQNVILNVKNALDRRPDRVSLYLNAQFIISLIK